MKNAIALLFVLIACGGPTAPSSYSIGAGFSEEEREVIRAVVDAWCGATDDCPREVSFRGEAHFTLVEDLPERTCPEDVECTTSGSERGGNIRIARNRPAPDRLDLLWRIAAHEWGHLCIDGHREGSELMQAHHQVGGARLLIDAEAVAAWHAGCP